MSTTPAPAPRPPAVQLGRIGCVSFLNAKPLIHGVTPAAPVRFDVPSGLLADLENNLVDIALCPVIDFQRSGRELVIVPVGGIGCDGPTLTVRLFSRVPLETVQRVHADTDSHTSVALMRVLLDEMYARRPEVIDYDARAPRAAAAPAPETLLLIGDKVVTDCPTENDYPHQLDLGEAWRRHTGLPFVFAVWMARAGEDLGDLPAELAATRQRNAGRIGELVERYAAAHGWPADLAEKYLGHWLKYVVGERELTAIRRFHAAAHRLGLTPVLRPLRVYA